MSAISSNWHHVSSKLNNFMTPTHNNNTIAAKSLRKSNRSNILQYYVQLLDSNNNTRLSCKLLIHLNQATITLLHNNSHTHDDIDDGKQNEHTAQIYTYDTAISLQCVKQLEWYKSENNRLVLIIVPVTNTDTVKSQIWDLLFVSSEHRERCYHILIRKCSKDIVVKHLTGDRKSHWLADNASDKCMQCYSEFTLLKRRSHCRSCGKLFCHDCSNNATYIESLGYTARPVRVCDTCYANLQSTESTYTHPALIQPCQVNTGDIDHSAHDSKQCTAFSQLKRHTIQSYDTSSIKRDRYGFRIFNNIIDVKQQRHDIMQQYNRWNAYLTNNTHMCLHNKQTQDLIKYGIVPEYRAAMWLHFSGANELRAQHSDTYYNDLLQQTATESISSEIQKDLTRTFPYHILFESIDGLTLLQRLLLAFSRHNTTVSYCQSLNFIAAILLIVCQSNEIDAFWLMCVIVDKLTAVHNDNSTDDSNKFLYYYQRDLAGAHIDQHVFDILIKQHLPQINNKLQSLQIPLLPLTINWFLCLFINVMPIEQSLCIWDMLLCYQYNTHIIFSTALLLLQLNQRQILQSNDFEQCLYNLKYQSYSLSVQQFIDKLFSEWLSNRITYNHVIELRQQYSTVVLKQLQSRQQHRRNATLRKSLHLKSSEFLTPTIDTTENTEPTNTSKDPTAVDTSVQLEYADKFELNLIDEYYKIANSPMQPTKSLAVQKSHPTTPNNRAITIDTTNTTSGNRQRFYSDVTDRSNPAYNSMSPTMSELDATVEELVDLGRYISLSVKSIGKRLTSPSKFNITSNTSTASKTSTFSYDDIEDGIELDEILHDKLSDVDS